MTDIRYFLSLENDETILKYRNSFNEPIWLFMRGFVYEGILDRKIHHSDFNKKTRACNVIQIFIYLLKSYIHNSTYHFKPVDIIYKTVCRPYTRNGVYYNKYTDAFASLTPNNTLTIEHPPLDWKWIDKRFNENVIHCAPILTFLSLYAKLSKPDKVTKKLALYIASKIELQFGLKLSVKELEKLSKSTQAEMIRMHYYSKWIIKICKKVKAKCLFMVGGSYPWYYSLIRDAKRNGIVTADIQHGYILPVNSVYYWGESIVKSKDVKCVTPQHLLLYGSWWIGNSNWPYDKKVVIGNPFREQELESFDRKKNKKFILLIGCANSTNEYIKLANVINDNYKKYKILFRPHPTERYETHQLLHNKSYSFSLDENPDLYAVLEESAIVISEVSTVLFEAVGLVDYVYVWHRDSSNNIIQNCPFPVFKESKELLSILNSGKNQREYGNSFWARGWKNNFYKYLFDLGVIKK